MDNKHNHLLLLLLTTPCIRQITLFENLCYPFEKHSSLFFLFVFFKRKKSLGKILLQTFHMKCKSQSLFLTLVNFFFFCCCCFLFLFFCFCFFLDEANYFFDSFSLPFFTCMLNSILCIVNILGKINIQEKTICVFFYTLNLFYFFGLINLKSNDKK